MRRAAVKTAYLRLRPDEWRTFQSASRNACITSTAGSTVGFGNTVAFTLHGVIGLKRTACLELRLPESQVLLSKNVKKPRGPRQGAQPGRQKVSVARMHGLCVRNGLDDRHQTTHALCREDVTGLHNRRDRFIRINYRMLYRCCLCDKHAKTDEVGHSEYGSCGQGRQRSSESKA